MKKKVALLVLDVRTNGGVRPHHVLGQAGVCLSGVEEREEGERLAGGLREGFGNSHNTCMGQTCGHAPV